MHDAIMVRILAVPALLLPNTCRLITAAIVLHS